MSSQHPKPSPTTLVVSSPIGLELRNHIYSVVPIGTKTYPSDRHQTKLPPNPHTSATSRRKMPQPKRPIATSPHPSSSPAARSTPPPSHPSSITLTTSSFFLFSSPTAHTPITHPIPSPQHLHFPTVSSLPLHPSTTHRNRASLPPSLPLSRTH